MVGLTPNQKDKISGAIRAKKPVTIRLSPAQFVGADRVMLTERQINKIMKCKKANTGVDITFSIAQLQQQRGGWIFPLLAGLAGSILPSLISKFTGRGRFLSNEQGRGLVLPGTRR